MLPIVDQLLREQERQRENLNLIRRRTLLRRDNNAFDLPDRRFIELFRLDKELARNLIELLRPHLNEREHIRGISVEDMVLCALRFYATGSYQRCLGENYNFGMGQSTIHKYIHIVTNAIHDNLVENNIKFPTTEEEHNINKGEFLARWGFPGTIGVVDGTQIAILRPHVEEHNFLNRKGFHSINVQIICDHNLKIINVFANYGGSTHDSFIWRNSQVKEYMQNLSLNGVRCWLIGDSGYPLSPYLMTPIANPVNEREERFNMALRSARNSIERCIGVLKTRFRCLLKERVCRYSNVFVTKLVKVCASLHNMCIDGNIDIPDDLVHEEHIGYDPHQENQEVIGVNLRQTIVNQYFA